MCLWQFHLPGGTPLGGWGGGQTKGWARRPGCRVVQPARIEGERVQDGSQVSGKLTAGCTPRKQSAEPYFIVQVPFQLLPKRPSAQT